MTDHEATTMRPSESTVHVTWKWLAVFFGGALLTLAAFTYKEGLASGASDIANLANRLTADEARFTTQSSDITQIKSDISFIKGLLQQKYNLQTIAK